MTLRTLLLAALTAVTASVVACSPAGSSGDGPSSADDAEGVDEAALAAASSTTLDWHPGHYVLTGDGRSQLSNLLASPIAAPFAGVEVKYQWSDFETSEGDYTAGFQQLDADLAVVAGAHKQLIMMLMYKDFGTGAHGVPPYMRASGPWCVDASGTKVCGEYAMSNGSTAMIWQGNGSGGVADRLSAWFTAVGKHVMASPYRDAVAGIALPETALSAGKIPLASVGYTQPVYLTALERDAARLVVALPTKPIMQYINFFPPNATAVQYLRSLADWALAHPHVGLGCPDVAPKISPPGYDVLEDAKYQGHLPFNVAVEAPDYGSVRTTGLLATYDLAIQPATTGMRAQMVTWFDDGTGGSGDVFSLADVSRYIAQHPMPNTARPTW